MNMQSLLSKLIFISALIGTLSACVYRMPTDDDYVTVPTTNNPNITREKTSLAPGMKY